MASPHDRILSLTQKNNGPAVRELVRNGTSVTHCNRVGQTAFHIAALWGNTEALAVLIELTSAENSAQDMKKILSMKNKISGATPLHAAANSQKAIEGRREAARLLVDAGADVNATDAYGSKPAEYTDDAELRGILGGRELVVHNYLREWNEGDVEAMKDELNEALMIGPADEGDAQGQTPLMLATTLKDPFSAFIATGLVADALGDAAKAAASKVDNDGKTALHHAVSSHPTSLALVERVLSLGGDVNKADYGASDMMPGVPPSVGRTALHYAVDGGGMDVVAALLEGGADPELEGDDDGCPHHLAFFKRPPRLDIIALLATEGPCEAKALLGKSCKRLSGNTILHEAAKKGDEESVSKLLLCGADLNVQGRQGMTPLHLAARSCKDAVVRTLLEGGADVAAKDSRGKTARESAEAQDPERSQKVLEAFDQFYNVEKA